MSSTRYSFVILGLSMTSSWGNGHATTYRALARQLVGRGHDVLFLERDVPCHRAHRDWPRPGHGRIELYGSREELYDRFGQSIRYADVVMLGSCVPEGAEIGHFIVGNAKGHKVFYDFDTPITLRSVAYGKCDYLSLSLVPRFDLYLSFAGGAALSRLERKYGARRARPLYCSVDPELYFPERVTKSWDLGYLGSFSADRQPTITQLLLVPARALPRHRFAVAGTQYPEDIRWPPNMQRIDHVPPREHRAFYGAQRLTLNTTRPDMVAAGYSPSVRLFEAGACGTPVVSDVWTGIESFFAPGREILLAQSSAEVAAFLTRMPDKDVEALGERARKRVLAEHTAAHRAEALEGYLTEIRISKRTSQGKTTTSAATSEAEP